MTKVKMDLPEGTQTVQEEKIPYDKLYAIAESLKATNAELYRRLNDVSLGNFFTRLEFLFKVVKFSEKFPESFVKTCIDEIVDNMTMVPPEKEGDNKENE